MSTHNNCRATGREEWIHHGHVDALRLFITDWCIRVWTFAFAKSSYQRRGEPSVESYPDFILKSRKLKRKRLQSDISQVYIHRGEVQQISHNHMTWSVIRPESWWPRAGLVVFSEVLVSRPSMNKSHNRLTSAR